MVVDPQERETIEYALSEQRWGGYPWELIWEWNEWTQQEADDHVTLSSGILAFLIRTDNHVTSSSGILVFSDKD
ncbi:hypothetical protein RhiirC2_803977 [Rhizophagus irregularis]|uniref:Uncharacterized protein n=1 Tax=Rhizophagus irregularis TaxID=588596 RepID=A0A2N1L6V7_9GLOM|nr:hypothetical protein RhiirC2_803977 [Rhizophagus irregularis]